MSDLTFKLTVATNVGKVRTNNEDNFIVCPVLSDDNWFIPRNTNNVLDLDENGCLLVVADGMGGMNAGEVASEIAVESIKEIFRSASLTRIKKKARTIEKFLEKVIVTADKNIKNHVESNPQTSGMGTTVVLAWVVDGYAHIAWCGDSRAYCYNPERGLWRLTRDHSYVQQLVDSGKLDPDLAFDHPNSNIITRSLGDSSVKAKPDVTAYKLMAGDTLILCSDGLCGLCRDDEISSVIDICNLSDIEDIKTSLISAALDAGGYDNVTVALFQCISIKEEKMNSTVANFERLPETQQESSSSDETADVQEEEKQEEMSEEKGTATLEEESLENSEDKDKDGATENTADDEKPLEKNGRKNTIGSTVLKKEKRTKHSIGWIIFLLVLIILAAGAAYYYYFK